MLLERASDFVETCAKALLGLSPKRIVNLDDKRRRCSNSRLRFANVDSRVPNIGSCPVAGKLVDVEGNLSAIAI